MKKIGRVGCALLAFLCVSTVADVHVAAFDLDLGATALHARRERLAKDERVAGQGGQREMNEQLTDNDRLRVTTLAPGEGLNVSRSDVQAVQEAMNPRIIFKASLGLQLLIIGVGLGVWLLRALLNKRGRLNR
jgi:hypothetical protein